MLYLLIYSQNSEAQSLFAQVSCLFHFIFKSWYYFLLTCILMKSRSHKFHKNWLILSMKAITLPAIRLLHVLPYLQQCVDDMWGRNGLHGCVAGAISSPHRLVWSSHLHGLTTCRHRRRLVRVTLHVQLYIAAGHFCKINQWDFTVFCNNKTISQLSIN